MPTWQLLATKFGHNRYEDENMDVEELKDI
jgi:hypothetical protein